MFVRSDVSFLLHESFAIRKEFNIIVTINILSRLHCEYTTPFKCCVTLY